MTLDALSSVIFLRKLLVEWLRLPILKRYVYVEPSSLGGFERYGEIKRWGYVRARRPEDAVRLRVPWPNWET